MYKNRYSCHILIKLSQHIIEKSSNIKFLEIPSTESWVVPCWRIADVIKVIVAFRNLANAAKKKKRELSLQLATHFGQFYNVA
jgi:hypothetical protein